MAHVKYRMHHGKTGYMVVPKFGNRYDARAVELLKIGAHMKKILDSEVQARSLCRNINTVAEALRLRDLKTPDGTITIWGASRKTPYRLCLEFITPREKPEGPIRCDLTVHSGRGKRTGDFIQVLGLRVPLTFDGFCSTCTQLPTLCELGQEFTLHQQQEVIAQLLKALLKRPDVPLEWVKIPRSEKDWAMLSRATQLHEERRKKREAQLASLAIDL